MKTPARVRAGQHGAALLLAMMILALVTTLAAGMVWQQRQAVAVEAAERARVQAGWVLRGALDWARLIVREDLRAAQRRASFYTWARDPWGTPLAEARLSSFLAVDRENNADADLDAAISGGIADAQAKFNLRGLLDANGQPLPGPLAGLQRLADAVGAPGGTALMLAGQLARSRTPLVAAPGAPTTESGAGSAATDALLAPERWSDMAALGLDPAVLARLAPLVDIYPLPTAVNANTAPRDVLLAAIDGIDAATAERLVAARERRPFDTTDALLAAIGNAAVKLDPARVGVASQWFSVSARLRLEERVVEERSLLQRDGDRVRVWRRERLNFELR